MVSNLRISVAELIIWALLATAGLAWTVARVFDGIERAWDWLRRDSVAPLLEDDEPFDYYDHEPLDEMPPPLPPERTWEQMTSHQLPAVEGRGSLCPVPAVCIHGPAAHLWTPKCLQGPVALAERLERRVHGEWEAEHRAHYAAMGFDYPSGLMARVRELAP